jgi:hypothetical protein
MTVLRQQGDYADRRAIEYQSASTPPPTTARLPIRINNRGQSVGSYNDAGGAHGLLSAARRSHAILIRRFRRGHIAADILPQHGRLFRGGSVRRLL